MGVVGGWLLVPLVLALLVGGHGLLIERLSGISLPGPLLPGVGLASLIVVTGLLTITGGTARLAAPVAAAVAVAGVVCGRPWRRLSRRGALLTTAAAVAVFILLAAPSLLTGQASITGYLKLDDSATWLAITSHVIEHGRDLDGLAPSSHRRTLESWLVGGYPVGSFLPLGAASRLIGQDPASSYQAVIAAYAAILALGMSGCFGPLIRSRRRAALIGVVAVQASTFYGYAQWGGIKEAAAAALLPPLAFLAARSWQPSGARSVAALTVVAGAVHGVLGLNGAAWSAPALLVGAFGAVWRRRRTGADISAARPGRVWRVSDGTVSGLANVALLGAILVVASLPALVTVKFLRHTTGGGVVADQAEVANLVRPLSLLQVGGLWPVTDFRFGGSHRAVVWMAFVCLLSALSMVALAVQRRAGTVLALAGITAAGAVPALIIGSPWIDAKVMAITSPVVLALAVSLPMVVRATSDRFSRTSGTVLLAVLIAGTGWSTVSVARNVYVTPMERFAELRRLGDALAGQGPTLALDFEIYADRYFLREADAEGATDLRYRRVARRDGQLFPERSVAEIDEVAVADLWVYRTIVRRRSPTASRPPTGFDLVHAGRSWEAWQRRPDAPPPVARLPLGAPGDSTAVPACDAVQALSLASGADGLVAVRRDPGVAVPIDPASAPPAWSTTGGLSAAGDGRVSTTVDVPAAGRYQVWVGGSVLGRLEVSVDRRSVGVAVHELAHAGQWLRFRTVELDEGPHEVSLDYSDLLRSGASFPRPPLGPIALTPGRPDEVVWVSTPNFRDLCDGRSYDWIEAVPAGGP